MDCLKQNYDNIQTMAEVDLKGKKILVVDDEPDLREILRDTLEFSGAEVHESENGVEAFKLVEQIQFDAVVSDIRMSGGDGMTLARNILSRPGKHPTVLLVTGFADIMPVDAYDIGVQGFIFKPFKLNIVTETLALCFSNSDSRWTREIKAVVKDLSATKSIQKLLEDKKMNLGTGGIFIAGTYSEIKNQDYVRLKFSDNITIEGVVKWVSLDAAKKQALGIGVEFVNLSEPAKQFFKAKIADEKPRAFIPKG